MVFSRKISPETRALVRLLYHENNYSIRQIATKVKISKSSVSRFLKESDDSSKKGTKVTKIGRPNKLSDRDRRLLRRSVFQLRKVNPNFTLKELVCFSGINNSGASYSTFRREMRALGFQHLQARKKGVVNQRDIQNRLHFAKKCKKVLNKMPDLFHKNISFYLDGVSFVFKTRPLQDAVAPQGKIWRKRSEGLRLTSKGSKQLPGGKQLHFMVAIAFDKGVILAEEYKHMSGEYFSDFVKRNFSTVFVGEAEQKWFIMDNDPSQRSKAATKALNNAGATLFAIPARSPDLNPIENLFHIVKKQLKQQTIEEGIYNEKLSEFQARVRRTLLGIPISYINNLLLSMPKRIECVINSKGIRTKY